MNVSVRKSLLAVAWILAGWPLMSYETVRSVGAASKLTGSAVLTAPAPSGRAELQGSIDSSRSVSVQERCAAAGVVMCVGFDSAAEVNRYAVIHGIAGSSLSFDSSVPGAEGGGAAKFFVPANTACGAESCAQGMSGGMIIGFPRGFGQNSDFYFQFRQRWDASYLSTNFNGEGWKQVLLYQSGGPCSSLEIMLNNQSYRGYPQANTACGSIGFAVGPPGDTGDAMTDPRLGRPTDFLYEQGANPKDASYNCYRNATPKHTLPNCAVYRPDNWETFYCHVHVGTFGQTNSQTQCWVAYEGQSLIQYINMPALKYDQNNSPSDAFHTIQFTNYDSRATGTKNPAGATWYDSFILSTQPIPAPNGPTPR
jgi:hypothetical protein